MCNQERPTTSRELVRKLAEKIKGRKQLPTARELAKKEGICKEQAQTLIGYALGLVKKDRIEQLIHEAHTGEIKDIAPVCSVHDKPK